MTIPSYIITYFSKYAHIYPKHRINGHKLTSKAIHGCYTAPIQARRFTIVGLGPQSDDSRPNNGASALKQRSNVPENDDRVECVDKLDLVKRLDVLKEMSLYEPVFEGFLQKYTENIPTFNEDQHTFSLIFRILKSIKRDYDKGLFTSLDSKRVFGFLGHIAKLSTRILENADLYAAHFISQDVDGMGNDAGMYDIDITREMLPFAHITFLHKAVTLMSLIMEDAQNGAIKVTGHDVGVLIEPLSRFPDDVDLTFTPLGAEISDRLSKTKELLGRIVGVQPDILDDAQFLSFFALCYGRIGESEVKLRLCRRLESLPPKSFTNLTAADFVRLLKARQLPPHVHKILMNQLKGMRPPTESPIGSSTNERSTLKRKNELQNHWTVDMTLKKFGMLCFALRNVDHRTIKNIDHYFVHLLKRELSHYQEHSGPVRLSDLKSFLRPLHLFASNKCPQLESLPYISRILEKTHLEPLNDADLFELCWSTLSLRVNLDSIRTIIEDVVHRISEASVMNNVKLLAGVYHYVGELKKSSNVYTFIRNPKARLEDPYEMKSDLLASLALLDTRYDKEKFFRSLANYIKFNCMKNIDGFDNLQSLSNFMFYGSATMNTFTYHDYSLLSGKIIEISSKETISFICLPQILWFMFQHKVYHEDMFNVLRKRLKEVIFNILPGQLCLCLFSLAHFNAIDIETAVLSVRYLKRIFSKPLDDLHYEPNPEKLLARLITCIWALMISDLSRCDEKTVSDMIWVISKINWEKYSLASQTKDLRKLAQICANLEIEILCDNKCEKLESLIPKNVMDTLVLECSISRENSLVSTSQDRVRRTLEKLGISYRSEYVAYNGIVVDFALSMDSVNFQPDLLIEVDGPHHYVIVCGESHSSSIKQFGEYTLIRNGRTNNKYRLLAVLGFRLAIVPWIEGYKGRLDQVIEKLLRDNGFTTLHKR